MKVVVNKCYGGFHLSAEAYFRVLDSMIKDNNWFIYTYEPDNRVSKFIEKPIVYTKASISDIDFGDSYIIVSKNYGDSFTDKELKEADKIYMEEYNIPRNNIHLVKVVEEMGQDAYGKYSKLEVIDIPDDIEWEISEYDGWETIEEKHRSW